MYILQDTAEDGRCHVQVAETRERAPIQVANERPPARVYKGLKDVSAGRIQDFSSCRVPPPNSITRLVGGMSRAIFSVRASHQLIIGDVGPPVVNRSDIAAGGFRFRNHLAESKADARCPHAATDTVSRTPGGERALA